MPEMIKKVAENKEVPVSTQELTRVIEGIYKAMSQITDLVVMRKEIEERSSNTDKEIELMNSEIELKSQNSELFRNIVEASKIHHQSIDSLNEKVASLELESEIHKRKMYLFNPSLLMFDNYLELSSNQFKKLFY